MGSCHMYLYIHVCACVTCVMLSARVPSQPQSSVLELAFSKTEIKSLLKANGKLSTI